MSSTLENISGTITKVSDLDMDADDIILANVKYKNGILGNIIIDVISRKPVRTLRILGSDGVLDWEKFDQNIKIYDAKTKATEIIPIPKGKPEPGYVNDEEQYQDEIRAFLNAVYGKEKYQFSFEENLVNLKMLYKIINQKTSS